MELKTGLNNLIKNRSIGSCIKSGLSLYADNFSKIFKSSWPFALLFSVLFSICGTVVFINILTIINGIINAFFMGGRFVGDLLFVILFILFVAGGLAETVFYSCGISNLYIHKQQGFIPQAGGSVAGFILGYSILGFVAGLALPSDKRFSINVKIVWRTIKAAVLCGLISALFILVVLCAMKLIAGAGVILNIVTVVVLLVVGILILPVLYVSMKYILNEDTRLLAILPKAYMTGLRHIAFVTAVMFVNIVTLILASFIIQLPVLILFVADTTAYIGTLQGDPLGMPENITGLTTITLLLAGFLIGYIRMAVIFTIYYMYGSIEAREIERSRFKNIDDDSRQYKNSKRTV